MRVAQLVTMGLGRGGQAGGHFIMFQAADCPLPVSSPLLTTYLIV